jgi:hypothetical protein
MRLRSVPGDQLTPFHTGKISRFFISQQGFQKTHDYIGGGAFAKPNFALAPHATRAIINRFTPLGAREPKLDPFARQHNTKAPTFFSRFLCLGTAGVDGFAQPWRTPSLRHPFC